MALLGRGVVKVVIVPYGLPESGVQWYLTYLYHPTKKLGMRRSGTDP